jgi:predicted ATPase
MTALADLLKQDGVRLLSVTGPGGVGKTRVALELARQIAPQFADGVRWIPLAAVTSPSLVLHAIAAALQIRETTGESLSTTLQHVLGTASMLLLLDNFEHVVEAAPAIAALLAACPQITVLVTSRMPLHVRGEQVYPLAPLAVPHLEHVPHLHEVAASPAAQLFVARVQATVLHFALTQANAAAVAAICRRVDGLPLALELAAARVKALGLTMLLVRLDQALPLLTGGARDLPERQQTMRTTIAWSYDLLDHATQAMFRRMAVFQGGWTLQAAEAVGSDTHGNTDTVLDALTRLVDASLVMVDTHDESTPRYRMLEPVRQYAAEQLERSDEAEVVRERHARVFVSLATQAYEGLRSAAQVQWVARLDKEYSNLRAAMLWLLDRQHLAAATELNYGILLFQWLRGHLSEGRRWMDRVLEHAGDAPPPVRAQALLLAGRLAHGQGDYVAAAPLNAASLALYRTLDDPHGLTQALTTEGLIAAGLGDIERAVRYMEEGLARLLAIGDTWNAAMLLNFWSAIPRKRGDYASAKQLIEQALALAQQHGDRTTMYSSLFNLASIAEAQGAYADALRQFRAALALAVEVGDSGNMVSCLEGIAGVAAAQGDVAYAARLWGAAQAVLEQHEGAIYSYAPNRAQSTQTIALARRQLPAIRWAALWHEGSALRRDQACRYALDVDPTPATPAPSQKDDERRIAEAGAVLTST